MSFMVPLYVGLAALVIGLLSQWLAAKFVGEEKGRVAGFSATIGILIGNSATIERSAFEWWLSALGGVLGLAVLWWIWFKKVPDHG